MKHRVTFLILAALVACLAGCGGGGSTQVTAPLTTVSATVTSGGSPVAGARVAIEPAASALDYGLGRGVRLTGVDGRVELQGVWPEIREAITMSITAEGYQPVSFIIGRPVIVYSEPVTEIEIPSFLTVLAPL